MFAHVAVPRAFHFPIPANKVFNFAVTNKRLLINIATILDFNYASRDSAGDLSLLFADMHLAYTTLGKNAILSLSPYQPTSHRRVSNYDTISVQLRIA